MLRVTQRVGRAVIAGLIAWGAVAAVAQAQQPFRVAPNLNQQNPFNAGAAGFNPYGGANPGNLLNSSPYNAFNLGPYAMGTMTSTQSSPIYSNPSLYPPAAYGGYYNFPDPFSGNLYGTAAVINAEGQLMISTQNAYLMREQVRREKLENRRRIFDQWLYERNNTPTLQDEFDRQQRLELRRSQNDPPVNEVLSAKALNDLLVDAQKIQGRQMPATDIPLDSETLRRINFAPAGKGSANAGLLKSVKNEGKLQWPYALRGVEFKRERDQINALAQDAIRQADANGQVDAATLRELGTLAEQMRQALSFNIKDMPTQQFIEGKRFLNDLGNGLRALADTDAGKFFNGKYAAGGKSVGELVKDMTVKGLRFAPAVPGDEDAYVALHRLMAAYDFNANANTVATEPQR